MDGAAYLSCPDNKKSTVPFPCVQWIFRLSHPLVFPPYSFDIYLKLSRQIVYFLF